MPQQNAEVLLLQVGAFNRRDAEGFVAPASPQVEWKDPMFLDRACPDLPRTSRTPRVAGSTS